MPSDNKVVSDTLLALVKRYLRITWDDEDEDIRNMIQRGMVRIDGVTGESMDYDSPSDAQTLLLDFCRYNRNYAGQNFAHDYGGEILHLALTTAVEEEREDGE